MFKSINSLSGVKILTKEAQRKISGGLVNFDKCFAQNSDGSVTLFNADSGNYAAAKASATSQGTHYCCDSCCSASWLQGILFCN